MGPKARLDNWLIVVPARLESVRLPRKPLQDLAGKPLIVQVCENLAPLAKVGASIVVATDSTLVQSTCLDAGFKAVMTRTDHISGTDRCNEAAQGFRHSFVMNVQGDEPFVNLDDLRRLASAMERLPDVGLATLAFLSGDREKFRNPNAVKVIKDASGYALYFSRSPIPYDRDAGGSPRMEGCGFFWLHLGIYAFRRETLERFCALPQGYLERTEKLEQLRAIEQGWRIYVEPAEHETVGIDTLEDLEAARVLYSQIK